MKMFPVAAALLALTSGLASAQCTWFVEDVPDFDQRRLAAPGIPGLPADGSMYCVPTATLNWFAYLANRGIPQPSTLAGPRDWQSDDNYDRVTNVLSLLGALMSTDAIEGTGSGQKPGAVTYNFLHGSNDLLFVSGWALGHKGERFAPSPDLFRAYRALGGYIQTSYGSYNGVPLVRDGGHALTAVGVWGCDPSAIFQFRDPAFAEPADTTQSKFRVSLAAMTPVYKSFRAKPGSEFKNLTLYRLDVAGASNEYLDAIFVIMPMAGIFGFPTESNEIEIVRPVRPAGNPLPEVQRFSKPTGLGDILDVAFSGDMLSYYYITAESGRMKPQVLRIDALTGETLPAVANPVDPRRMVFGRENDAYIIEGPQLIRYDMGVSPANPMIKVTPSLPPAAIAYNDLEDRVLVLTEPPASPGARRVLIRPRTLLGSGVDAALPVSLGGEVHIAPDATDPNALWVSGQGGLLGVDAVLYRLRWDGRELLVTESLSFPRSTISGVSVTGPDGLILTLNNRLAEKIKDSRGNWIDKPDSRWTGRRAEGRFTLASSRTNFDPAVQFGPEFRNLPDPIEFPSHPDCFADCDESGRLDFFDFLCFQNLFSAGDLSADCDLSWRLDFFDFLCFQSAFAAGCD